MSLKKWFDRLIIRFGKPSTALTSIFKTIRLDQSFTEEQLSQLAKALNVAYFEKGDIIFKEGDVGDDFYFIRKGSVRVYSTKDNTEIVLARLEVGDFFGEQALLEEHPGRRMSSARAITDCEVLYITHADYIKILNPEIKSLLKKIGEKQLFDAFCKTQEVLGSIDPGVLEASPGSVQVFQKGETIFRAGDQADKAYFILSGAISIEIPSEKSPRKVELGKGALFGELGVLSHAKRAGSATAKEDVKLLSYDEASFRALYNASPALQQYVNSMKTVYQIKHRDTVNIYFGKFLDYNSVIAVYNLEDGSTVRAAKAVGNLFFTMSHSDTKDVHLINYELGGQIRRNLGIKDRRIMSVSNFGDWEELREVCNLILNREPITDDNIQSFINSGNLGLSKLRIFAAEDQKDILCPCMNFSRMDLYKELRKGTNSVEEVVKATGVGSICGICLPKVVELVGLRPWTAMKLIEKVSLQPTISSFRFQSVLGQKYKYKPGQTCVISALIDDQFISRTYTFTSVSDKDPYVEITVRKEPKGYFSPWLFDRADQDSLIRFSDPTGEFTLPENEDAPVVCFVQGIGITTAIAFARATTAKGKRRLHIDYSVRGKGEFIFTDELNQMAADHKNITVHLRAMEEDKWLEPDQVKKIVNEFPNAYFYICTSEALENSLIANLTENRISADRMKIEKFLHANTPI